MNEIVREIGRTVRAAVKSWPVTIRTCVLVVVTATTLTGYHLLSTRR